MRLLAEVLEKAASSSLVELSEGASMDCISIISTYVTSLILPNAELPSSQRSGNTTVTYALMNPTQPIDSVEVIGHHDLVCQRLICTYGDYIKSARALYKP